MLSSIIIIKQIVVEGCCGGITEYMLKSKFKKIRLYIPILIGVQLIRTLISIMNTVILISQWFSIIATIVFVLLLADAIYALHGDLFKLIGILFTGADKELTILLISYVGIYVWTIIWVYVYY